MICILKRSLATNEIEGWIIAADYADARRQADFTGDQGLAAYLYRSEGSEILSQKSQLDLPLNGSRYTLFRS